ncbi:MAG TPA: hypothetical protein VKB79_21045 [Bryobacteraceae bacterium]|nr:hypothetical protein [Bryobacteraceae bacterium]
MTARATGTFEVKIVPLTPDGIGGDNRWAPGEHSYEFDYSIEA